MEKKKHFLKKPHLDGGKEYLIKHIKDNLQYPAEALENKIEGDVVVKYRVTDRGELHDVNVEHGIGHGCDEEAIRLVKLLKFQAVKNRGVRLTSGGRMKIPFRLPQENMAQSFNMVYTAKPSKPQEKPSNIPDDKPQTTYSYTIKLS
jgi:TonB family protein